MGNDLENGTILIEKSFQRKIDFSGGTHETLWQREVIEIERNSSFNRICLESAILMYDCEVIVLSLIINMYPDYMTKEFYDKKVILLRGMIKMYLKRTEEENNPINDFSIVRANQRLG